MKKLTFKTKFYIFLALLLVLALFLDIFDVLERNSYNYSLMILLLIITICAIQYRAAKKGLETMLSINRDYNIRKTWNKEHQFDWEKVRLNQIKWAPICIGLSLIELLILMFTGDAYILAIFIIAVINLFIYLFFTRPVKHKTV
ncbi:MAG: hypothetical protein GX829_10355 [Clostridium sp.]|nr:hypothetical protein [Clostridium sp.]